MQGHKQFPNRVVLRFRLSERVSRHILCRRLGELPDWRFLYEQTQTLYSHMGQPSLDPVVFFKLVLVGRLENLVSDRRLVEHCAWISSTFQATKWTRTCPGTPLSVAPVSSSGHRL